jgi:hypothetical protein
METTRRGFFGLVAGALVSAPAALKAAPAASMYQPVECGFSVRFMRNWQETLDWPSASPWLIDRTDWYLENGDAD